jgi:hypothetical protein
VAELLAFAEAEFALVRAAPAPMNGKSYSGDAHVKRIEEHYRRIGKPMPEIVPQRKKLARDLHYVWQWYMELAVSRGAGMTGPEPIRWQEIKAWCELTGVRLEQWELRAIRAIDRAFNRSYRDE